MNIKELLEEDLGTTLSTFNEPFNYVGRSELELDGGQKMIWLYNDEDGILSVMPDDEELVLFDKVDEALEAEGETILYLNKEYEFSYEDAGKVSVIEGDSVTEVDDRYMFSDYEAADGRIIRLVSNENTGEKGTYFGRVVAEEDLAKI